MTTEEFHVLRPKPWVWRRRKTGFTLEDATGRAIGWMTMGRPQGTNQHEWMRHVAAAMSDISAMIAPEDPDPAP